MNVGPDHDAILDHALLSIEAEALGHALLERERDEATFRVLRIEALALEMGATNIVASAREMAHSLTQVAGAWPRYGVAFCLLTDAIEETRARPLPPART